MIVKVNYKNTEEKKKKKYTDKHNNNNGFFDFTKNLIIYLKTK